MLPAGLSPNTCFTTGNFRPKAVCQHLLQLPDSEHNRSTAPQPLVQRPLRRRRLFFESALLVLRQNSHFIAEWNHPVRQAAWKALLARGFGRATTLVPSRHAARVYGPHFGRDNTYAQVCSGQKAASGVRPRCRPPPAQGSAVQFLDRPRPPGSHGFRPKKEAGRDVPSRASLLPRTSSSR